MRLKTKYIPLYVIIISLIIINTPLLIFSIPGYIAPVINLIGLSAVILIIVFHQKSLHVMINTREQQDEKQKNEYTQALSVYTDVIDDLIQTTLAASQKITNEIQVTVKPAQSLSPKELQNIVKTITNSLKTDTIQESSNTSQSSTLLSDIYYKIPFIVSLMTHVIKQTEEAAMVLIEKFDHVTHECFMGKESMKKSLSAIKEGIGGKDFNEVIEQSRSAMNQYNNLINDLVQLNKVNGEKLNKISEWIDKISDIIININNISEKNHIISINSSIEAARLGEAGKGFNILANEIRMLNEKTENMTKEIDQIMSAFKAFNSKLLDEWKAETDKIIANIQKTSHNSEEIMTILINSYQVTNDSVTKSTSSASRVSTSLNKVLESLQFQDITRQQIESICSLLDDIRSAIIKSNNIHDTQLSTNTVEKIKQELLNNIRHFDNTVIIKEFEEVSHEIFNRR